MYIPPDIVQTIRDAANLKDVAADFVQLKKSGASFIGNCNLCGSSKMTITPSKSLFKCWKCDTGGGDAIAYLTKVEGHTFAEAILYLADRYSIEIPKDKKTTGRRDDPGVPFRDQQLIASGIPLDEMTISLAEMPDSIERYQIGSLDKYGRITTGDDMVLNYLNLDGSIKQFDPPKGRPRPFQRIRYLNPDLHKDRTGKPAKYRSPYKGGNHIWIPNHLIRLYASPESDRPDIETLVICEGEKKADKLTLIGIPAVGIAGIHNFEPTGSMSREFGTMIRAFNIQKIVFLLDADLFDLSIKNPEKSIDIRPKTFYRAVQRFRDYFFAYTNEGIDLALYFAYHKDRTFKGIDDLVVLSLKGKEAALAEDLEKSLVDREGAGHWIQSHKITDISDYNLKKFWRLHTASEFIKHYKDDLKKIPGGEFLHGKIRKKYNPDSGEIELCQAINPIEQFWSTEDWTGRNGKEYKKTKFRYQGARLFLRNRGFGKYRSPGQEIRYIHTDEKILSQVDPDEIQDFVLEMTETVNDPDVLEMILAGADKYFGDAKLRNMYAIEPDFIQPSRDEQIMIFKNQFWRITADTIESHPLRRLPAYVWKNQIIDFEPEFEAPVIDADFDSDAERWKIHFPDQDAAINSDIVKFFLHTSNFNWRKEYTFDKSSGKYVPKVKPDTLTDQEIRFQDQHFISKMIATGYVLHDYKDLANMKAIIAMDGKESEVGKSEGGTGKSILATMFEHIVPTFVIDAKSARFRDDAFLYEGVDERTKVVVLDDCRVNIDFEFFLSQITRGLTVNPKGQKKFFVDPPKFIFSTNHAIAAKGNSFKRRQYPIAFSDFFNEHRTPYEVFGRLLFKEWDFDQWNTFYNFAACCIQLYLKHGFDQTVPGDEIERRRLRQDITEEVLEWCLDVFGLPGDADPGRYLDVEIERSKLYDDFGDAYPKQKRYISQRYFRDKLKAFCQYAGFEFNPGAGKDGRIRSGGVEYFVIASEACPAKPPRYNPLDDPSKRLSPVNLPADDTPF